MSAQTHGGSILAETAWTTERLRAMAGRVGGNRRFEAFDIDVIAPAVDESIAGIPALSEADVAETVDDTRDAAREWQETPPEERAEIVATFADRVADDRDNLVDLIQLETGKARTHAFEEVLDVPQSAQYHANVAPDLLATDRRSGSLPLVTTTEVQYDPVGVVGIISPFNYPLMLSMTDAIPALLAGNGVVLKPDDRTPFTALRLLELLEDAGLPEGVLAVVTGDGPTVGSALIDAVDYVTFTGSSETGRLVAEQAGRNLIDCSMELGGKNPMIVLADADPAEVARSAVDGAFNNAGQLCLAFERIYVEEPLFEAFLDAFVAETDSLSLGASFDYGSDVGSLIDGEHLSRVQSHVADAVEAGATVHTGGSARPDVGPHYYEPTILTGLPEGTRPACEEAFGPVVAVYPVDSAAEAIERANDTRYGLNASVWSADRERALSVAREIEAGTVNVNETYKAAWAAYDAPMGGMKDSGLGRRHGREGLYRYTEPKTISASRVGGLGDVPPGIPKRLFNAALWTVADARRRLSRWSNR